MKHMVMYSIRPGCRPEAISRFLKTQGAPPPGVTLLGRWHKTDHSGGFSLYESDNPAALFEAGAMWADVLETHDSVVVEDAEAGAILAKLHGK
jgi:hypothetical protein